MVWYAWALCALYVIGALVTVALIGRPRKPIDHSTAVCTIISNSIYIWAIVALAT